MVAMMILYVKRGCSVFCSYYQKSIAADEWNVRFPLALRAFWDRPELVTSEHPEQKYSQSAMDSRGSWVESLAKKRAVWGGVGFSNFTVNWKY